MNECEGISRDGLESVLSANQDTRVNPLIDDRLIDLLLDLERVEELCAFPYFADHDRETFGLYVDACRRVGRQVLWRLQRHWAVSPGRKRWRWAGRG